MKLLQLKINSEFRNLKGLNLNFKRSANTYVIIGNNGSGKSNILEAISSIFKTLYYDTSLQFEFSFFIRYEIQHNTITISNNKSKHIFSFKVNQVEENPSDIYLPNRIICNYSGEDRRLWDKYYNEPFEAYINSIKNAERYETLKMIHIDKNLWKIIFLVMLCCRDEINSFDLFIKDILNIKEIQDVYLKINQTKLRTWRDTNVISYFIRLLNERLDRNGKIALNEINIIGDRAIDLFNKFLGASSVIDDLTISFNGNIESTYMSEGEKKLMVILFILEVIADESTLVLMDEPDSHIHVSRKKELKTIFDQINNRDNIITSHSPTLTATFEDDAVIMLDKSNNGYVEVVNKDKRQIVAALTNGMWSLQQQNIFLNSHDDILLVEGKTDEIFLRTSLRLFQKNMQFSDLSFEYLPCGGAKGIVLIKDKFTPKAEQIIVALFDGDKAGCDAIKEIFGTDYKPQTFGKARKAGNIWCSFYPARNNISNFNIEDYFPRPCFLKYILKVRSLDSIITKDSLKKSLADDCQKGGVIKDNHLKNFGTVFDRIAEIKQAEIEGKSEI